MNGPAEDSPAEDSPAPHGPKDAALADPPSTESAEPEQPRRTLGLGNVLAEPTSSESPTTSESEDER
jgi:hypothetical protein